MIEVDVFIKGKTIDPGMSCHLYWNSIFYVDISDVPPNFKTKTGENIGGLMCDQICKINICGFMIDWNNGDTIPVNAYGSSLISWGCDIFKINNDHIAYDWDDVSQIDFETLEHCEMVYLSHKKRENFIDNISSIVDIFNNILSLDEYKLLNRKKID
jgi:hypothetical protein